MNFEDVKNNKLFKVLLNFLYNNIDVILFFTLICIKLMSYARNISSNYLAGLVFFPIAASVLILISFSLIFKKKSRVTFLYIADIVISLILIADLMYYRYFKDITTLAAVRNAKLLQGVSASVGSVANIKDLYYLLDIFILLPVVRFYKRRIKNIKPISKRLLSFLVMFILGASVNAAIFYWVSKVQPTLLTAMSNRIYLTTMIGNINFHMVDSYNYISTSVKNSKKLSEDRENEIKTFLENNNKSTGEINFKGEAEGKNLIVIQVEALQNFVINQKVNGQEITPNLNRWVNKCMYFDNWNNEGQWYAKTLSKYLENTDALIPTNFGKLVSRL